MARVDAFLKIGFKPLWNWHTPHSWDTLKAKYSLLRGQICEAGQFRNHGHEALIRLLQCLSWPRYPRDPHYPEKMPSSPKVLSSLHVHGKKHLTGQGPWETQQPLPAPTSRLPEGNHSQLFTSFFPRLPPLLREHAGTTTSSIFHTAIGWQLPEVEDVSSPAPLHSAIPPATHSSIRQQPGLDPESIFTLL